jgi:hypothetical protein
MADQQKESGFKLPVPGGGQDTGGAKAPASSSGQGESSPGATMGIPGLADADTTSRDMTIAGGVLLVLVIAFFFAKTAYANALVAKKVAPRSANAAGWWLFILLTSTATAAVLGFANQAKFLTIIFMAPLGLIALISLILMLMSSRR